MRILFLIGFASVWLSNSVAVGSVGWLGTPPLPQQGQKAATRYEWLQNIKLFYTVAHTPEEVDTAKRLINAAKKPDERDTLLSEMVELGFVPAVATVGADSVLVIIPPSALSKDKTLALIQLMKSLYDLQARFGQEIGWSDLSPEAQSALVHLIEAHLPYDSQRRQHVLERLQETTVYVRFSIDFKDAQGTIRGVYMPELNLPLSAALYSEHDDTNRKHSARFVSSMQACTILVSEPIDPNLMYKLMHEVYPAALSRVLEAYQKQFQKQVDVMLQPLFQKYGEWLGRKVSLSQLPQDWLAQLSPNINPEEPLETSWRLSLCVKSPSMPREQVDQVDQVDRVGACTLIAPINR